MYTNILHLEQKKIQSIYSVLLSVEYHVIESQWWITVGKQWKRNGVCMFVHFNVSEYLLSIKANSSIKSQRLSKADVQFLFFIIT